MIHQLLIGLKWFTSFANIVNPFYTDAIAPATKYILDSQFASGKG